MRALLLGVLILGAIASQQSGGRPRARDLGIAPGSMTPGPLNAITDVAGVRVGHTTIVRGDTVRTGVTAILPHAGNLFQEKVPGAVFVGNAFGKLAGSTQVHELGTIESPIVLTNTLSVGTAVEAVVRWTIAQPGNENVRSVNALVGETNDGTLNDIRGLHVTADHVRSAIAGAAAGPVDEGAVGAGTGTIAFGWKAGIGTSSRTVRRGDETWTVGVLVQSNYGGKLVIDGVPVWKELTPSRERAGGNLPPAGGLPPRGGRHTSSDGGGPESDGFRLQAEASADSSRRSDDVAKADGSCMIVVATDAPLDARTLQRLAARAIFALARTGSTYSNGSGDFAIAFSTHPSLRVSGGAAPQPRTILPTDGVSGLFEAVLDATEEAVDNSLLKATDTTGNGRTIPALPVEPLKALLKKYGRGAP
jgi:D-aminopeptidase